MTEQRPPHLVNDRSGLCLRSSGDIDPDNAGVYTNITRLASKLKPDESAPLVTIEMEDSALLVKEYDGHAVAVRVPSGKNSK